MKAEIINGYYTGNYANIGGNEEWTEVESVPEAMEDNPLRLTCYQYTDGQWIFDETKYQELISSQQNLDLEQKKQFMISQCRHNLSEYFLSHTLSSSCHGGAEKQYSITSEKQQHLANMILTASMAEQAGIPYQPSWNTAGEPCTYDWTLAELQQLAIEMEAAVRPLISRQQQMEAAIREATALEELETIDIRFDDDK